MVEAAFSSLCLSVPPLSLSYALSPLCVCVIVTNITKVCGTVTESVMVVTL